MVKLIFTFWFSWFNYALLKAQISPCQHFQKHQVIDILVWGWDGSWQSSIFYLSCLVTLSCSLLAVCWLSLLHNLQRWISNAKATDQRGDDRTIKRRDFSCHNRSLGRAELLTKCREKLIGKPMCLGRHCVWGEMEGSCRTYFMLETAALTTSPLRGF